APHPGKRERNPLTHHSKPPDTPHTSPTFPKHVTPGGGATPKAPKKRQPHPASKSRHWQSRRRSIHTRNQAGELLKAAKNHLKIKQKQIKNTHIQKNINNHKNRYI
ncbi:MAG: hypothetical protein ACK40A_10240, partial [Pannonibacter indicus]